ncbi:MAG: sigma-70 family RNA polymerase sigma factor [Lachnospiraceae bacterium]|nr:sigma-70 family RNA polymerase sigma factor [Lachnospiraceae bacterium]
MEDDKIIGMLFDREQKALEYTSEKYGRYLHTVAFRILGNEEDSEECVNDTLLSAWNAIPPTRPTVFSMFLAKITRNFAINRRRAETAAKRGGGEVSLVLAELEETVAGSENTESGVLAEELSEAIRGFVNGLPEREGDIFTRRYFFAQSVKEIAAGYRLSQTNVSVILNRTRSKLREYLTKEQLL